MAKRLAPPKLLHSLRRLIRPINSSAAASSSSSSISAVSPLNLNDKADHPTHVGIPTYPDSSVLNLDDVKELFSSVPTSKLLRSALILHAAAVEPMVDLGMWVMKSSLMETPVFRELAFFALRHTFYDHFCAGKSPAEACQRATKLWDSGLRGMLAYGLEHVADNEPCDRNLQGFLDTVESTKSLPQSSVSFVVAKISAICPLGLLRRISDLLRWEYMNESFKLPWRLNTLPIFSDSSPFYHTPRKPDPLTPEEESYLSMAHQRLQKLCQKCVEANVPLAVDAEDSSVQPAIDYFTYSAAIEFNKDDNPIVYGTLQSYLKDSKERLFRATNAAEKMGIPMGFKLVRGAYMSSERELASSLGVESPVHNTIDDTHNCFNDCASFLLEKTAEGTGAVVISTHNIASGNRAAAKATELGIEKENQKLQFAQLYGMSDSLSFALKNAGFQVSKYMTFGPVDMVMPFLLRRAEENRGILSASTFDRELLRKELGRRLKDAVLLE